jgi:aldehyde dehydrogenase (NAD+)
MPAIQEDIITRRLNQIFSLQRKNVLSLRKESVDKRKGRLKDLRTWIQHNRTAIHDAAFADFGKNAVEFDGVEIFPVLQEINLALKNIDEWTQPKKVSAPLTLIGTRSFIQYEPRGVCLIISPWNYPFNLAVSPLISALAAGNSAMIKPSELTPAMSTLLSRMMQEIFTEDVVAVCEGGPEVSQHLLSLSFDHIFFTGSPAIGKVVMKAAAENLTSVTLELGGKSPTIITDTANLRDSAKRTAVAKFINNGQTCVAPDYVMVDEKIFPAFVKELIDQTQKLFLEEGQTFESSPSYCRIVNEKHFSRLNDLVQDALNKGAKIEYGGKVDRDKRFFHPMILTQIPDHAHILDEEIFGPVLPVITYKDLDQAIAYINGKPKALALYVFTAKDKISEKVLQETSAGAVCVNDCAIHFLHHGLPFGGVNNSGIGKSHGYYGFLTFSNEKPVLKQKNGFTSISALYPPYTRRSKKLIEWLIKWF